MKKMFALPLIALVAACGSNDSGTATQLQVVGSSTVYPFTTKVVEQFNLTHPETSIVVESTGTGSGMKLFCAGVGEDHPDMVNASRRMKASEYQMCLDNGVTDIIEMPVGIDGLTLIQASGEEPLDLTVEQIYMALAANPYGEEQKYENWSDIDASLPDEKIRVLGPPPTSGTRDSFAELILEAGCASNADMKALKESDEERYKTICTKVREDGAFVEAGENDNLLVQKVSSEPGTLGVLGYSFLEANMDKVQAVTIGGSTPNEDTISSLAYPGARKLYLYVKKQHLEAKPAIGDFLSAYKDNMGAGNLLANNGLVPLGATDQVLADDAATRYTTLSDGDLD